MYEIKVHRAMLLVQEKLHSIFIKNLTQETHK